MVANFIVIIVVAIASTIQAFLFCIVSFCIVSDKMANQITFQEDPGLAPDTATEMAEALSVAVALAAAEAERVSVSGGLSPLNLTLINAVMELRKQNDQLSQQLNKARKDAAYWEYKYKYEGDAAYWQNKEYEERAQAAAGLAHDVGKQESSSEDEVVGVGLPPELVGLVLADNPCVNCNRCGAQYRGAAAVRAWGGCTQCGERQQIHRFRDSVPDESDEGAAAQYKEYEERQESPDESDEGAAAVWLRAVFPGPAREVVLAPAKKDTVDDPGPDVDPTAGPSNRAPGPSPIEPEMLQACALATHGTMDPDISALAHFVTGREWGRDPTKIRLAKRMLSKYQKILTGNANAKENDTGLAREPADPLNNPGPAREHPGLAQVFKYWKTFGKGAGFQITCMAGRHRSPLVLNLIAMAMAEEDNPGLAGEHPGLAQVFKYWKGGSIGPGFQINRSPTPKMLNLMAAAMALRGLVFRNWKRFGKGRWWKRLMIMYLIISEDSKTFNFLGDFVAPWSGKLLRPEQQKKWDQKERRKAAAKHAAPKAKAKAKAQ